MGAEDVDLARLAYRHGAEDRVAGDVVPSGTGVRMSRVTGFVIVHG
ncbi:hypothetical protein [[Kitasatospora] papulosa]